MILNHRNPDGSIVVVEIGYRVEIGNWVKIGNEVKIGDGVKLHRSPLEYHGLFIANEYSQGFVRIGCEIHSIEEWRKTLSDILDKYSQKKREKLVLLFLTTVEKLQEISPLC